METVSLAYRLVHFVHLTLAALWLGASVASHVHLTRASRLQAIDARKADYERARWITVTMEMPALTVLVVAGLVLLALNAAVLTEPWFHIKLLVVVLLVILFVFTSIRQRLLGEALADADPRISDGLYRSCRRLRAVSVLLGLLLLWAVTFRPGAG